MSDDIKNTKVVVGFRLGHLEALIDFYNDVPEYYTTERMNNLFDHFKQICRITREGEQTLRAQEEEREHQEASDNFDQIIENIRNLREYKGDE